MDDEILQLQAQLAAIQQPIPLSAVTHSISERTLIDILSRIQNTSNTVNGPSSNASLPLFYYTLDGRSLLTPAQLEIEIQALIDTVFNGRSSVAVLSDHINVAAVTVKACFQRAPLSARYRLFAGDEVISIDYLERIKADLRQLVSSLGKVPLDVACSRYDLPASYILQHMGPLEGETYHIRQQRLALARLRASIPIKLTSTLPVSTVDVSAESMEKELDEDSKPKEPAKPKVTVPMLDDLSWAQTAAQKLSAPLIYSRCVERHWPAILRQLKEEMRYSSKSAADQKKEIAEKRRLMDAGEFQTVLGLRTVDRIKERNFLRILKKEGILHGEALDVLRLVLRTDWLDALPEVKMVVEERIAKRKAALASSASNEAEDENHPGE
jgi:hypothetical protein